MKSARTRRMVTARLTGSIPNQTGTPPLPVPIHHSNPTPTTTTTSEDRQKTAREEGGSWGGDSQTDPGGREVRDNEWKKLLRKQKKEKGQETEERGGGGVGHLPYVSTL